MIGTILAGAGIKLFDSLISNHGEELVSKGIEKVTGIKLDEKKELSPEEIKIINENAYKIKELDFSKLELIYKDRSDARQRDIKLIESKDWLVRNTGSLLALFTVLTAFILDVILIYMVVNGTDVNPLYTLIQGAMNVRAVQVLSFYFGDNKTSADRQRGQ